MQDARAITKVLVFHDYQTEAEDPDSEITASFRPILPNVPGEPIEKQNSYVDALAAFPAAPTTKIRVLGSYWKTTSSQSVVQMLIDHKKGGSDVRIAANHHNDPGCHYVDDGCEKTPYTAPEMGVCETTNNVWRKLHLNGIRWAKIATHAKVLLMEGWVEGRLRRVVYAGSMNMTYEETMPDAFIGIHNDGIIFSEYERWFRWLCQYTSMNTSGPDVCAPSPMIGT